MTTEIFDKALQLSYLIGARAIILSGGEPFDHPDIFELIAKTQGRGFVTMVASNGLFALDSEMRNRVARCGALIQVTNDPRYYPTKPLHHPKPLRGERLRIRGPHPADLPPAVAPRRLGSSPPVRAPMCFNLRSVTRSYDLISALSLLQMQGKLCSPSINVDGTVRAGEADTCFKLGTVDSVEGDLDEAIRTMHCNRCGLQDNLQPPYLEAIGERHARP